MDKDVWTRSRKLRSSPPPARLSLTGDPNCREHLQRSPTFDHFPLHLAAISAFTSHCLLNLPLIPPASSAQQPGGGDGASPPAAWLRVRSMAVASLLQVHVWRGGLFIPEWMCGEGGGATEGGWGEGGGL